MASHKPVDLLDLPREIRDKIYSHLTHRLNLQTPFYFNGTRFLITIINAPMLEIFLVSSEIRKDLIDSGTFTNTSATAIEESCARPASAWPIEASLQRKQQAAIRRIKHLEIRFGHFAADPCGAIAALRAALRGTLSSLQTIRISKLQFSHFANITDNPDGSPGEYTFPPHDMAFPLLLPKWLGPMVLIQRVVCTRLRSLPEYKKADVTRYAVFQLRLWLYNVRGRTASYQWKVGDFPDGDVRSYDPEFVDGAPAFAMVGGSNVMRDWVEEVL